MIAYGPFKNKKILFHVFFRTNLSKILIFGWLNFKETPCYRHIFKTRFLNHFQTGLTLEFRFHLHVYRNRK